MHAMNIDLSRFALLPGGGRRIDTELQLPRVELGGAQYTADGPSPARLDVSRTTSGWAIRLRFDVTTDGPCTRCLEQARLELAIDTREIQATGATDEDLKSPYIQDDILDLEAWARDALALAMPAKYLCRPDCAGLCPICGESLNDAEAEVHRHDPEPDPRWQRLRDLKLE